MTIAVGDKMPDVQYTVITVDGPVHKSRDELFAGRKIVLFAVPGAFTPTCSNNHLPGFVANLDAIKAKGVAEVMCMSVNDPHVMKAWAKQSGAGEHITFLADGSGGFAKAVGLDIDLSGAGMGLRSKRYAMLIDDGTVKVLNIEDSPGKAETSSAETMLKSL